MLKYKKGLVLISVALISLIALSTSSFAAWDGKDTTIATMGDKNSSNAYRVKVTKDTSDPTIAYFSFASDTAYMENRYEVYSTDYTTNTLLANESGKTIISTATYGSKHSLPRASVGLNYTLCNSVEYDVINPIGSVTLDTIDTSDTIVYSISGTFLDGGDSLLSPAQSGECVSVICTTANLWDITNMGPTAWTDNSTN